MSGGGGGSVAPNSNDIQNFADLALDDEYADGDEQHVPIDYFRRPTANGGDVAAKRQKVVDQDGLMVVTDGALLGNFDDDDEGRSTAPFAEHMQHMTQQRGHESLERGVHASELIRDAVSRQQPLSKGQKKIYTLTKTKNYTNDDLMNKLEMDDEGLAFASVLSPETDDIHKVLGPEVDREECYGCSRGVGVARMDKKEILDLRQMILDLHGTCHPLKFVALIYLYFRDKIMDPCNQKIRKGEALIEVWNPRSIYDHITRHINEPSFVLSGLLGDWREHYRILRSSEVYKISAEVARNGRELEPQDYRVRKRGHDMMKDSTDMIIKLLNCNPEKMMFHNPTFNVAKASPGIIAPKENVIETTKMQSVWENKEV